MTTREEIITELNEKAEYCYDKKIEVAKVYTKVDIDTPLEYYFNNLDFHSGEQEVAYSRWAFTQLLGRFHVPVGFYDRSSKALKHQMFTEHITQKSLTKNGKKQKELLFRFDLAQGKPEKALFVRAVLSSMYGIIDDKNLFPVVLETLKDEDITYKTLEYDSHITRLFIEFNDCSQSFQGIRHTAGLLVSNSETGRGAVWVEPVVTIPGYHFADRSSLRKQGADMRIVHKGTVKSEQIVSLVKQAKEIAQLGLVQLAESWNQRISGEEALSYAKDIDTMPRRLLNILYEEWDKEESIIRAEAAKRILDLARELPLFQRTSLEQTAGHLTGAFEGYKDRIEQIMSEI